MEEHFSFKAEIFFAKNWKFIFWGLILVMLVGLYTVLDISNRMANLEKIVRENNSKVVLTTTDGRAIRVIKTPLKAEYLKKFAVSIIGNGFIIGRKNLTNDFTNATFLKPSDILNSSTQLANIWDNFIDKKDKQAKGEFISYLNWILSAIAQDKLPEHIAIKNMNTNLYEYTNNKFKIIIDVHVNAESFIIAKNKYRTQKGSITIEATGKFALENANDVNPYGMKISTFKINMITKGK